MKSTELRQLIRESINEYIRDIDEAGDIAAEEAKMAKYQEAIELREKKIQSAESLEEMKDMIDPAKVKALKNEIKDLQNSLKKTKTKLEKLKNKGKKVEKTEEEKEVIDETPEMEVKMEEIEPMNESFLYMQKLAGVITEAQYNQKKSLIEAQLNEDILELKQMSKQLYSFLKKKGFLPSLKNDLQTGKPAKIGEGDQAVQIVVTDKPDERVIVAITPHSVAKILVGGGDDWTYKARKFGDDSSDWFRNPEITKYVDNLGNEILKQIFDKYPNMEYGFSTQEGFWYILTFRFKKTAKGAEVNPNQRPNAPKPSA